MSIPDNTDTPTTSTTTTDNTTQEPTHIDKLADALYVKKEENPLDQFWQGENDLDIELPGEGESFKGVPPLHELAKYLPEPVQQQMHNLRADYQRKTQELAGIKKQLQAEREAIQRDRESIRMVMKNDVDPNKLITEQDVWDSKASLTDYLKQEQKLAMAEQFSQVDKQWQQEQEVIQMREFRDAHPEFQNKDFTARVAKYYTDGLSLEDAYHLVKAKHPVIEESGQENYEDQVAKNNKVYQRRKAIKNMSTGSKAPRTFEVPDNASLAEVQRAMQEYKDKYGVLPPRRRRSR